MADPSPTPALVNARATAWAVHCPNCGLSHDVVLEEIFPNRFRADDSEAFIICVGEGCGAFMEVATMHVEGAAR